MNSVQRAQHQGDPEAGEGALDTDNATITMLNEHIPLSLIMDLSSPVGPRSEELFHDEGEDEMDWLEDSQGA